MNTAIIMLGSNINAEQNLEIAIEKLSEYFEIDTQSSILITKPHGKHYHMDFQNQAVKLLSAETAQESKSIFKQIEADMGRTAESKQSGDMPIDIDLIFWNDVLVHDDFNRFEFVTKCVNEVR